MATKKKVADEILDDISTPEGRRAAAQARAEAARAEQEKENAAADKKREAAEKKAATKKVKTSDEFPPEVYDSVRLQTLAQRGM